MKRPTKPKPPRLIHHKQAKMLVKENYLALHLHHLPVIVERAQHRLLDESSPYWHYYRERLIDMLLLYQYVFYKDRAALGAP